MTDKGKAKRGRRTQIGGAFAWRLVEMLSSPAYRVLSQAGHRILARLEIELAAHGGEDNGRLPTTFDQFEEYGVHRHAIAPALREVAALGFVEITERGRAGNAEWRRPSLYRLTYRHQGSTNPTDEWRKVSSLDKAEEIAATSRKEKSQWRKAHQTSVRKPHRSRPFHSAETATTGLSAETTTTSISRGQSPEGEVILLATKASPTPRGTLKGQARAASQPEGIGQATSALLRSPMFKKKSAGGERAGERQAVHQQIEGIPENAIKTS